MKHQDFSFYDKYPDLNYFCLFVGYPKSGHSLIGGILDAHPEIIISHELNVLNCIQMGFSKELIYDLILKNSSYYASKGRRWRGYSYIIPNQWNGKYRKLKVIGDKKGGGTTKLLRQKPDLFKRFQETFSLSNKYIHVMRNPYDSISTLKKMSNSDLEYLIDLFENKWDTVSRMKKVMDPNSWLDIYFEDFISNPVFYLKRMCDFFEVSPEEDYIINCVSIINSVSHQSRREINWPSKLIYSAANRIQKYPFLEKYQF